MNGLKRTTPTRANRQTGLRIGMSLICAGALWISGGLFAVALLAVVGTLWMKMETPYAVAIGQLLYAVWIAEASLFGLIGIVSFGLLLIPALFEQWSSASARVGIAVYGAGTAMLTASLFIESVVYAAGVLVLVFGLAAYSVHRYELVRFGLVEESV